MSQSPPNYMNGVPVKISERYKPPPKISLPKSVCQRLTIGELSVLKLNYNLNLEENVLSRISEWKAVRVKENDDRRERIRLREEFTFKERREFEEKQKKLLTEVYYPSSDDEEVEAIEIKSPEQTFSTPQGHFSPPNRFDTILTPTVVPGTILNNKFTPLTCHSSTINNYLHSNDLTKINYSDFENDGNDPFENMELKTINDLDILAQVLNSTKLQNISNNCEEIPVIANDVEDDRQLIEPNSNYQFSTSPNNLNLFQTNQTGYNQPEYASTFNHLNENFVPSVNHSTTIPPVNYPDMSQNYYYNQTYASEYLTYGNQTTKKEQNLPQFSLTSVAKSKSKSVPDILKELNDEINNSEMKRTRNNSQTITSPVDELPNYEFGEKSPTEQLNNGVFGKLSTSSQKLAKNISLMGFPLDRVSRVTQQFGSDDKKVSFFSFLV